MNSTPCGDPHRFVRPGITTMKVWVGDSTGAPPWDGIRIGDFPPFDPFPPRIVPYDPFMPQPTIVPQRLLPMVPLVPNTPAWPFDGQGALQLSGIINTSWRTQCHEGCAVFSLDVPGCKADDVKVQISSRELSAVATRRDGQGGLCLAMAFDHSSYDARGATATVEDGVLAVRVPYRGTLALETFQVPVSGK